MRQYSHGDRKANDAIRQKKKTIIAKGGRKGQKWAEKRTKCNTQ